jgi:hypothetical protein
MVLWHIIIFFEQSINLAILNTMKKIRTILVFLGLLIALIPAFLSVWGGVKNWIVTILGLLVAVLSYLYIHAQQTKK